MRFFCAYSTNIKISLPLHLPNPSRVKDQRETKDEPRNDLPTPNHQKVLFIKIVTRYRLSARRFPAEYYLPFLCLLSSGVPDNTPRLLFVYYLEYNRVLLASSPISYSPQGVL